MTKTGNSKKFMEKAIRKKIEKIKNRELLLLSPFFHQDFSIGTFQAEILAYREILQRIELKKAPKEETIANILRQIKDQANRIKDSQREISHNICKKCLYNMLYHLRSTDTVKTINDIIQGPTTLTWDELLLVDTCYLQRLKYISQMSYIYHVIPSAHHTRFEHSLGTAKIVKQMLNTLESQTELEKWLKEITDKILKQELNIHDIDDPKNQVWPLFKKVAIYAALLHDIGHGPYSHLTDELYTIVIKLAHEAATKMNDPEMKMITEKINNHTSIIDHLKQTCKQILANEHYTTSEKINLLRIFLEKTLISDLGNQPHEVRSFYLTWSKPKNLIKIKNNQQIIHKGCLSILLENLFKSQLKKTFPSTGEDENSAIARYLVETLSTLYLKCERKTLTTAYFWIELWKKIYQNNEVHLPAENEIDIIAQRAEARAEKHHQLLAPLHELINGPLDADKMDYLARDAYYSGIDYTKSLQITRIIHSIRIVQHANRWVIAFDEKVQPDIADIIWKRALERTTLQAHHVNQCCIGLQKHLVEKTLTAYADILEKTRQSAYAIIKTLIDTYRRIANQTDIEFTIFWPIIIHGINLEHLKQITEKLAEDETHDIRDLQQRLKLRLLYKRLLSIKCTHPAQISKKQQEKTTQQIKQAVQKAINKEEKLEYITIDTAQTLHTEIASLIKNATEIRIYNRANRQIEKIDLPKTAKTKTTTITAFADPATLLTTNKQQLKQTINNAEKSANQKAKETNTQCKTTYKIQAKLLNNQQNKEKEKTPGNRHGAVGNPHH